MTTLAYTVRRLTEPLLEIGPDIFILPVAKWVAESESFQNYRRKIFER